MADDGMEAIPFDIGDLMDLAEDIPDEPAPSPERAPKKEEIPDDEQEEVQYEEEEEDDEDGEEYDEEEDDEGEEDEDGEEELTGITRKDLTEMLQGFKDEILSLKEELKEARGKGDEAEAEPEFQAVEFVDSDGFNEAMSSSEGFNKVLNEVYQAGQQGVIQQLPALVTKMVAQKVAENELVRDFYRSNPDLAKVRPLVTEVAQEVAKELGPDASTKKFLTELAKQTRDRMKASASNGKKRGKSVNVHKGRNPGNVRAGGARRGSGRPGKKGKSTIADEIAGMMDL